MRKLVAIFLSVVFLVSAAGVLVSFHFCHDNLVDVSFFEDANACCCGKTEKNLASCCTNTSVSFSVDQDLTVKEIQEKEEQQQVEKTKVYPPQKRLVFPSLVPKFPHKLKSDIPPEDKSLLYHKLIFYS